MQFDLSNVKESSFDTLPEGKYVANVTNAEMKETKDGTGQYIRIELTVAQGEAKGRKLFTNFNVKNKNAQAVEIGLQHLKSMLVAANFPTPDKLNSIADLNGITVGVKTRIKKDEQYGDKAEVHYFIGADKAAPTQMEKDLSTPF